MSEQESFRERTDRQTDRHANVCYDFLLRINEKNKTQGIYVYGSCFSFVGVITRKASDWFLGCVVCARTR